MKIVIEIETWSLNTNIELVVDDPAEAPALVIDVDEKVEIGAREGLAGPASLRKATSPEKALDSSPAAAAYFVMSKRNKANSFGDCNKTEWTIGTLAGPPDLPRVLFYDNTLFFPVSWRENVGRMQKYVADTDNMVWASCMGFGLNPLKKSLILEAVWMVIGRLVTLRVLDPAYHWVGIAGLTPGEAKSLADARVAVKMSVPLAVFFKSSSLKSYKRVLAVRDLVPCIHPAYKVANEDLVKKAVDFVEATGVKVVNKRTGVMRNGGEKVGVDQFLTILLPLEEWGAQVKSLAC